jgi:hypothetical protein
MSSPAAKLEMANMSVSVAPKDGGSEEDKALLADSAGRSGTPGHLRCCHCCTRQWHRRRVSLYWVEKFWLVVRLWQLFGLIWAFSRAWPLPFTLRNDTRWVVLFNADIVSYFTYIEDNDVLPTFRGSVFGVYPGYWMIAVGWAGAPIVLALLAWVMVRYARRACSANTRPAEDLFKDIGLNLALLIHLPLILNLSHAYVCSSHPVYTDGLRLSVDPQWACFSWQHLALMGGCAPTMLFFLVLFPLWMWKHVNERLVFRSKHQHERYLRWKEAEYVFFLSAEWRREKMWLFTSFRRPWLHPFDRCFWLISTGGLVAAYTYLRFSTAAQTDVLFGVLAIWSLWHLISKAYRCGTSHLLALCVYVGLSILAFWGVMRAHNLKSSLVVDTAWSSAVEGICLGVMACCGAAALIIPLYPGFGWPRGIISDGNGPASSAFAGSATTRVLMSKPNDVNNDVSVDEEQGNDGDDGQRGDSNGLHLLPGFLTAAELRSAKLRTTMRSLSTKLGSAFGQQQQQSARNKKAAGKHYEKEKDHISGGGNNTARSIFDRKTASVTPAGPSLMQLEQKSPAPLRNSSDGSTNGSKASSQAFPLPSPSFARGAARIHPVPPLMAFSHGGGGSREATSSSLEPSSQRGGGGNSSSRRREDPNEEGEQEGKDEDDLLDALLAAREAEYENEERKAVERRVDGLIQSRSNAAPVAASDPVGPGVEPTAGPSISASSSSGLRGRSNAANSAAAKKKQLNDDGGDHDHLALAIRSISSHKHKVRADSDAAGSANGSALGMGNNNGEDDSKNNPSSIISFDGGHIKTSNHDPLSIAEVAALEAIWVSLIKAARSCILKAKVTPSEIVDVPLLRAHARTLKREWKRAALCGHILAWSLEEATDDCMRVADEAIKRSTVITTITRVKLQQKAGSKTAQPANNSSKNEEGEGGRIISKQVRTDVKQASSGGVLEGISHAFNVLAHGPLETIEKTACYSVFPNCCGFGRDTLRLLKERMDAHDSYFILANPKRSKIAFKLFVLATLMGPKHATSVKRLRIRGINDSYFVEPALLAAALQRAQATKGTVDMVKLADECERLLGRNNGNTDGGGVGSSSGYVSSLGIAAVSALAMSPVNNNTAATPLSPTFTPFSPAGSSAATAAASTAPTTPSVAATAAIAIAQANAGTRHIASAADAEAEEDRLLEEGYASIPSAYRDVDPDTEIPLCLNNASTLSEVVDVVLPGRMRAEVKHWLARMRRIAAATRNASGGGGLVPKPSFFGSSSARANKQQQETALSIVGRSDAILLAQEREPPQFDEVPGDAVIALETKKILFSVYQRLGEVISKERSAASPSPSLPALLRMKAKAAGWMMQLYPKEAATGLVMSSSARTIRDDEDLPSYFTLMEPITPQLIRRLLSEADTAERRYQESPRGAAAASTQTSSSASRRAVVTGSGITGGSAAATVTAGSWRVSAATDLSTSQTAAAAAKWNQQQLQQQKGK